MSTTTADFKADKWLRRDEAAKFFVNFAKILWKTGYIKTDAQCTFLDINQSWSDLKKIVVESCKLWLFQGGKGKFNPQNQLTNEQSIAVLIRLLAGNQSETWVSRRSDNYYKKANELKLLRNVSMNSQKLVSTRGNVWIILYNGNAIKNTATVTSTGNQVIIPISTGNQIVISTHSGTTIAIHTNNKVNYGEWNSCGWTDAQGKPNSTYFKAAKLVNLKLEELWNKGTSFTPQYINDTNDTLWTSSLSNSDKCAYSWLIDLSLIHIWRCRRRG